MDKRKITEVVDQVINEAGKAKGWSLAKLTRYLGKGSNTLHRWKTGQTTAYDMEALIELFKMAEMSMDRAFGLVTADEQAALSQEQYEGLLSRVNQLDRDLAGLRPLARLTAAVSGVVSAMAGPTAAEEEEALMADRAEASFELAGLRQPKSKAEQLGSKAASKLSRRKAQAKERKTKTGA